MKKNHYPLRSITIFILSIIIIQPAFAHHGDSAIPEIMAGILHPLLGIDHLLVILGISLLAAQKPKRIQGFILSLFLVFMMIGVIIGSQGYGLAINETFIATSVVGTGLLIYCGANISSLLCMLACALFSFIHGHTHGNEMINGSSVTMYLLGLFIVTASLLLVVIKNTHHIKSRHFINAFNYAAAMLLTVTGIVLLT